MCTAVALHTAARYFGRNLDLDRSYGEEICIMPRRFPLTFRKMGRWEVHSAMIGMATVAEGLPLYYDAVNEHGLAMAGLNFPGNAWYGPEKAGKDNVAPFELIPWILGQCKNLKDARKLLSRLNLADIPFSDRLPQTPLHWMITDGKDALTVESAAGGLRVYENPVGVLTNNPPFPRQLENLRRYRYLRTDNSQVAGVPDGAWSQGLGAVGLPGDVSSMSRFVRMVFGREHSLCPEDELSSVSQMFHLLSSVEMIRGLCRTDEDTWDITRCSACMNLDRSLYYYTTYDNRQITCVELHRADLESGGLHRFPLVTKQHIRYQNRQTL